MVNHDPANTRAASSARITPAEVGWLKPAVTVPFDGNVWATPIVAGDSIFVTDASGKLTKLDAKTGKPIWSHAITDYDGIAGSAVRGSAAYADGLVIIGDRNGAHVIAVDAASGARRWITPADANPAALITGSPIIDGDHIYVGVSSLEGIRFIKDRHYTSTFRGSLVALDLKAGKIQWKTYTMPASPGWSGGSVMSVPGADAAQKLVFFGTDHQYTMPPSVIACLEAAPNDWNAACLPADARFDAVTAVDMATGKPRWTFFGAGASVWQQACGALPDPAYPFQAGIGEALPVRLCPPVNDYLDWAFAAGSPQLFKIGARNVVGMAQKSGVYWLLDAATGKVLWHTLIGPYSEPGGLSWGAAYDGQRLYVTLTNLAHVPFRLASGAVATGGAWTALDPATGKILWQTADPQGAADYAAPVEANGVVYVASLAPHGDQMYALDAATGSILWRFAAGAPVADHPAVVAGRVYWGTGFALFEKLFAKTTSNDTSNRLYIFSVGGK